MGAIDHNSQLAEWPLNSHEQALDSNHPTNPLQSISPQEPIIANPRMST